MKHHKKILEQLIQSKPEMNNDIYLYDTTEVLFWLWWIEIIISLETYYWTAPYNRMIIVIALKGGGKNEC